MNDDYGGAHRHLGRLAAGLADGGRLIRGHELFESGAVGDLVVLPGSVSAAVGGSRWQPYDVTIKFSGPPKGRLPDDPSALRFTCSCPDWGDPCKHAIAVMLALGEVIDEDPALGSVLVGTPSDEYAPPSLAVAPETSSPTTLAVPVERPAWAEQVEAQPPPTTLPEWFGEPFEGRPASVTPKEDPLDQLLALGSLAAPDGPDISGAVQLLLIRLMSDD